MTLGSEQRYGQIALNATSSSGLPVTYTLESGNADIVDNVLQIFAAGLVSITASQEGNSGYLPAEPVNQSFCINPLKPEIISSSVNDQTLLICNSTTSNQWFINRDLIVNAFNDTFFIEENEAYSVQVEADLCFSEMSDVFYYTSSRLSYQTKGNIVVFPNPTEGIITFHLPGHLQGSMLQISVLDLSGRYIISLASLTQNPGQASIDLGYLEPGFYMYVLLDKASKQEYRGQIIIK